MPSVSAPSSSKISSPFDAKEANPQKAAPPKRETADVISSIFSSLLGVSAGDALELLNLAQDENLAANDAENQALKILSETNAFDAPIPPVDYAKNFKKVRKHLLKFDVNGKNFRDSCKNIFISQKNSKGDFLVLCDFVYFENTMQNQETFFANFSPIPQSVDDFNVSFGIIQKSETTLSKLADCENLKAKRTGNFFVVRDETEKEDFIVSAE